MKRLKTQSKQKFGKALKNKMGNCLKVMEGNLGNFGEKREAKKTKTKMKKTEYVEGKKTKGKIVNRLCKKHYLKTPSFLLIYIGRCYYLIKYTGSCHYHIHVLFVVYYFV